MATTTKQDLENLKSVASRVKSYVDTKIGDTTSTLEDEITARKDADKTLQTNIDSVNTKINNLDYSTTAAASKTITSLSQTDGKISATYSDIAIAESQVTNLVSDLKTLTTAISNEITNRTTGDTNTLASAKSYTDTKIQTVQDEVDAINEKIPSEASSTNKLADKDFVNSSIATATATFRGTVDSLEKLKALTGDLNDYAFLKVVDSTTGLVKQYDRYKYSASSSTASTTGNWEYEYTLNNSSFTDAQWKAITSGVTSNTVTQVETNKSNISSHTSNTSNPHKVTATQVGLGSVVNTGDSATPVSGGTTKFTTGGAYTMQTTLQTSINNVSAKIDALDMAEITPSAGETLSSIKQVDGKVTVNKQTISISQTQINDSATTTEVTQMLDELFKA